MADWLVGLGDMEMAYVQARAGAFTDAEALRECGVPRGTFYDWPKERREYMRNLALDRKRDIATQAFQVLEENATAAAEVKAKGLKSRKEHIAQAAADSILDRVLGKPTMRVKQHVRGDRVIRLEWPDEGGIPPHYTRPRGRGVTTLSRVQVRFTRGWGGEDDTLGQVERQLCLACQLASHGGAPHELEEAP